MRVTLAITGASGAQYGLRLLEVLLSNGHQVYLMVSKAAQVVIATETTWQLPARPAELEAELVKRFAVDPSLLHVFGREQWMAPVASGSGAPSAMVICPCSTGSLSAIATGACNNLIERAADVALKERRKLIVVLRESPYSAIHLENMLKITNMGGVILPASPGFYHQPAHVSDLIDFIVARILNQLGIEQQLLPRWGEQFS
ncbi:flavin prenyltransferase UbiX [Zooshikella harenae]|uniref:Flavin prenyltransferase UbiX n=1 Tax=Zooshikella harenae TaxID=2827238 RepID=A0ABS5ZDM3_9GAMM|nr:flavin prenyltransferase UbiX [Zooshikella harenae]MBU2712162.1 UbiX family flavin prenyltransferase [Zooshikella harenae]